jgi:hypothetical protein
VPVHVSTNPQNLTPESGNIDPASQSIIAGGSEELFILPRWNEFSFKDREDKQPEQEQWHEDSIKLDTDLDLAHLNAKQADNINESPTASTEAMFSPNTNTNIPTVLHTPESTSQGNPNALLGIDSLPNLHPPKNLHQPSHLPTLLKTLFLNPLLWLSVFGIIFFAHRLYRHYFVRRQQNLDRRQRMRGRKRERREREEKRALRDEEEARWEIFETFGMFWGREEGFAEHVLLEGGGVYVDPGYEVFGIVGLGMPMLVVHESVLWERTGVDPRHVDFGYVDPEYEVFGIIDLESVVVIGAPIDGDEEELFPGAEAGPEECVA